MVASRPTVVVEVAFTTAPFSVSPSWTDISAYLENGPGYPVTIDRRTVPATLSLTLNNTDGRFTQGLTSGAYYPNVRPYKRVRVKATWSAVTYTLFDGHVDQWPMQWENGVRALVPLTATDALGMAARHTMRSLYEQEILGDTSTYYWTLADPDGSTTAIESSGKTGADLAVQIKGRTDPDNGGGNLEFGAGAGPGADGLSAPIFTSGTSSREGDYRWLLGPADVVPTSGAPSVSYEVSFRTAVAQSGNWMGVLGSAHLPTRGEYVALALDAGTGALVARWAQKQTSSAGVTVREIVSTGYDVWDGLTHHAIFVITDDFGANTTTGTLFVDGAQRATATHTGGTHGDLTNAGPLEIGRAAPGGNIRGFDGTLSHVAVFPIALSISGAGKVTSHYQAQQGWPNQTTDQRIAKLATYWGYHTTSLEVGESTLIRQATNGSDVHDAMRVAAYASEYGDLFIAPNAGGAVKFHNRKHRLNRAVGFTLTADQTGPGLVFRADPATVRNHVTVTQQQSGSTSKGVVVSDQLSIDTYDIQSETVETVLPQNHLIYRGQVVLARHAQATPIADEITIDALTQSTLFPTLLPLERGDAFAVSSLPATALATTVEFDAEGVQHDFDADRWDVTIPTSPRNTNAYAVVGSGTYSQVGSVKVGW